MPQAKARILECFATRFTTILQLQRISNEYFHMHVSFKRGT